MSSLASMSFKSIMSFMSFVYIAFISSKFKIRFDKLDTIDITASDKGLTQ